MLRIIYDCLLRSIIFNTAINPPVVAGAAERLRIFSSWSLFCRHVYLDSMFHTVLINVALPIFRTFFCMLNHQSLAINVIHIDVNEIHVIYIVCCIPVIRLYTDQFGVTPTVCHSVALILYSVANQCLR